MRRLQPLVVTLLGSVLFLATASSAKAQQWARFRGPDGTGLSDATTIPAKWTDDDYRWRVELPGIGYSSPVVWGDKVYVTSGIVDDGTQILLCLRTTDGGPVWKRSFDSQTYAMHQLNTYAASTPAVDDARVYFTWATPERYNVAALDKDTGAILWRQDLGPFVSQHGFGSSPVLFEDLVIVANDQDGTSSTIALERGTGEVRWKATRRTEKAAFATPILFRPDGGPAELILSSWAHGITSLDPRNGKLNWEIPVFKNRVVSSPVAAAGLIVAGSGVGGRGTRVVAVRPGKPSKGIDPEVVYDFDKPLPYVCTPVAKGQLLFLWYDLGSVTCFDLEAGTRLWHERVDGNFFGSPVCVGDRLYCISRDGEVVVLAAAAEFKELARVDLGEPSNSTPAVADGVMYLRSTSHLMALGGRPRPSTATAER